MAVGADFPRGLLSRLSECLTLRAGQIEPVPVRVIEPHPGRRGVHRCLGIEEEAFTHNLCILGKSRQRVNQKTILGAGFGADRGRDFTQNYQKSVSDRDSVSNWSLSGITML